MPSGANIELFKPLDKRQCRLKLKLSSIKTYIVFTGTLLKHQGVDILIEAAPKLIQHVPSIIFIIIGEGPMKDVWLKKAKNFGVQEHFIFTGQVEYEKVPIWIGSSDLCVAPFKKNTGLRSPVKIFDYMSCGRPVIASKINGTTDIFSNSSAILLVEPEEPTFFAHAIIDILNNFEKAKEMGQNGRDLVEKKYDRKKLANTISTKAQLLLSKKVSNYSHVVK
jgi:glycosyltransferase involved in cell wall biosynthesis